MSALADMFAALLSPVDRFRAALASVRAAQVRPARGNPPCYCTDDSATECSGNGGRGPTCACVCHRREVRP